MTDDIRTVDPFDRIVGAIDGLPDVRKTKPSTFRDVTPIVGNAYTVVAQTYQTEDGFVGFVETVSAQGSTRIVLPPKTMAALYRQRDSLIKQGRKARGRDRWERMTDGEREATVKRLRKEET